MPAAKARSRSPARASEALQKMPALMLGLERRPDRRRRCEEMIQKELPWLKCEFFPASDGKADKIPDNEVAETWNTKNNSLYGNYEDIFEKDGKTLLYSAKQFADPGVDYKFSPGERGCAHSHHRMWRRAAEAEGPMLILEDDVQLVFDRNGDKGMSSGKTFTARLEQAMVEAAKVDADVLYLGWSGHRDGNYRYHKGARGRKNAVVRKVEYVWTTVAYVIWPKGAKRLLEKAQPMDQPVDNFMAWEAREGRLNSFVVLDEGDDNSTWEGGIVSQFDFTGDSDIKKSDGGDQGDDATEFLATKVAATVAAGA
jgi:GR25 family glycosyltransferase involved in LPS biosynthesis